MERLSYKFIVMALGIILSGSCNEKKNTFHPERVIGYWKALAGENENIQFEKVDSEFVYSTFTYDRLASSGTWTIEEDQLTINCDDGTSTKLKVGFIGDTLVFNDGAEKYIRVVLSGNEKTAAVDLNDVEILDQIKNNVNVVFSEKEPFNEGWISSSVRWSKITTEVTLKSEGLAEMVAVANQVSKYLVVHGFQADTSKISEKVSSYRKGKICVMIRSRASSEPTIGEATYIDVISGMAN
ncbi:MAG: hypothetical protein HXX16_17035 [Bacteroidales bacterium]|nr:hypothetical protein [Bacteroidales bacterium]